MEQTEVQDKSEIWNAVDAELHEFWDSYFESGGDFYELIGKCMRTIRTAIMLDGRNDVMFGHWNFCTMDDFLSARIMDQFFTWDGENAYWRLPGVITGKSRR